ncbi:MAG: nicotinate-nucleotide--dimethylbenzimidazole phosphoribosyltransferase [Parahaliea sp.]
MKWYQQPCPTPDQYSRQLAREHQANLTKPAGSLGLLEDVAVNFAGWQSHPVPRLSKIAVRVFAADHGISRRGVSLFPPEVTVQMIRNFIEGGAAINILCKAINADFSVVNAGTFEQVPDVRGLTNLQLAYGSADFSQTCALSTELVERCLQAGRDEVDHLDCELFIAGEMGIGNTTSAAAIYAAMLNLSAREACGRGTGIDDATLTHKCEMVDHALKLHAAELNDPLSILRCIGGLEIAAICGAYLRCGQRGIPVLIDGFITTAAALLAVAIAPSLHPWLMAGHCSAEQAHQYALQKLELQPLLDLQMRLGEGSGATLAVQLLQAALSLHEQMATFTQATVSKGGAS